jgi:hypothetical protein
MRRGTRRLPIVIGFLVVLTSLPFAATTLAAGAGSISLATLGSAYSQNFDTLANAGTANTSLPNGWFLAESGTSARNNDAYGATNGSDTAGDVYSGHTGRCSRARSRQSLEPPSPTTPELRSVPCRSRTQARCGALAS